jgi:CheY-like chemotaxis protein
LRAQAVEPDGVKDGSDPLLADALDKPRPTRPAKPRNLKRVLIFVALHGAMTKVHLKSTSTSRSAISGDPTILVVDDDIPVCQTISLLLADQGFRVIIALDGEDGLQKFREIAPDVVLTDIMMPKMHGIALIFELRRERPEVKIIAMSGAGRIGNSDLVTIATKVDADAGLQKPFDDELLVGTLRALLEHPVHTLARAIRTNALTDRTTTAELLRKWPREAASTCLQRRCRPAAPRGPLESEGRSKDGGPQGWSEKTPSSY